MAQYHIGLKQIHIKVYSDIPQITDIYFTTQTIIENWTSEHGCEEDDEKVSKQLPIMMIGLSILLQNGSADINMIFISMEITNDI